MTPAAKAILAVTGLLTACVMFGLGLIARKSEHRHLLKNGIRVQGTIVSIERASDEAGMPMVLRYQFLPQGGGAPIEGRCLASAAMPYVPGGSVVVCYSKASPGNSIVLPPKGKPI